MLEYLNAGKVLTWPTITQQLLTDNRAVDLYGAAPCAVNGIIYFIGSHRRTNQRVEYQPNTNAWRVTTMPYNFAGAACVEHGEFIYVVNSDNNTVAKMNVATGAWTLLANAPAHYSAKSTLTAIGNKLYLVDVDAANTLVLRVYDIATNSWSTITAPTVAAGGPVWRFYHAATAQSGLLYIYGGYNWIPPIAEKADLWSYNPVTNVWRNLSPAPSTHLHSIANINGVFYTCMYHSAFYGYNSRANVWKYLGNIPLLDNFERIPISVTMGGKLYFGAGYSDNLDYAPGRIFEVTLG
jgi:N-acetylneuraminic acid mutarotase